MISISDEEIKMLLDDLYERYGYDFSNYSGASLKRRINRLCQMDRFPSFAEMRHRLNTDQTYLQRFVEEITVNVTEMFRDPAFYLCLRNEVLPTLAPKPFFRIWHAGCSSGEEVFSMAILLMEEGIYNKALIYATDLNPTVLERAQRGIVPLSHMKQYSENYIASGGKHDFSQYYTANYGQAKFSEQITSNVVFSTHNLVSDGSFNEFDLILCRNVLIYFDKELQDKVLRLFDESLSALGYLALGSKETIKFSAIQKKYKAVGNAKVWRKIV